MDTPQEIEVWLILPAVRSAYVSEFKKNGLKQKEISSAMGLTEAAVSQYLKNKRGNKVAFSESIIKIIKDSVKRIIAEKSVFREEFLKTLKEIKKNKFICSVCREHSESNDQCNICYN